MRGGSSSLPGRTGRASSVRGGFCAGRIRPPSFGKPRYITELELHLRATPGRFAAATARRALDPLDEHVLPETLAYLRLLVTELVTNSVRHSGMDDDDRLDLEIRLEDSTVRVKVTDPGTGFDPEREVGRVRYDGGWGLKLVDRVADRWGVERNDLAHVWAEIDLQPLASTA